MSDFPAIEELRVTFDAETIRAYGGTGVGLHSDEEIAVSLGFPNLVSWGTLTVLPFWELMGRLAGPDWALDGSLNVRLAKPVCAGDEVIYSVQTAPQEADGRTAFELVATTERHSVVATAQATIGSAVDAQNPIGES